MNVFLFDRMEAPRIRLSDTAKYIGKRVTVVGICHLSTDLKKSNFLLQSHQDAKLMIQVESRQHLSPPEANGKSVQVMGVCKSADYIVADSVTTLDRRDAPFDFEQYCKWVDFIHHPQCTALFNSGSNSSSSSGNSSSSTTSGGPVGQ